MSASYRLIGERRLRKYTEASASPVYAAESEVKFISSHLCDVPWEPANGVRDARMTWHTSENVGDAEHPVSGLDRNVEIRDQFDAALFCAGHAGGSHRAYANAACYRYELPDAAVGKTLESVVASVTSDPYNAVGARLALLTNSTGAVPTDCGLCRNGGRLVNGSYVQDASYHTPEGGVVKRRSEGTGDDETWYPRTEDVTLTPSGFVLQKYLFVFVLLENYNFNRGNWIEGSSFIENRISVTLNEAVTGWTEGGVVDLSSASGSAFGVSFDGSNAIPSGGSAVRMYEASKSGNDFPPRPSMSPVDDDPEAYSGHIIGNAATVPRAWVSTVADGRRGYLQSSPSLAPMAIRYRSGVVGRRMYLKYHPALGGTVSTAFLPGLALSFSKVRTSGAAAGLPTSEGQAVVSAATVSTTEASGEGLPAYQMLSAGTARFVKCAFGGGAQYSVPALGVTTQMCPVYVGGPSGVYVLGFLGSVYSTDQNYGSASRALADTFNFYFADQALGSVDLAGGSPDAVDIDPGAFVAGDYTITADDETHVATVPTAGIAVITGKATVMFAEQTDGGLMVRLGSYDDARVFCRGSNLSVIPVSGRSAGSFVVSGGLERVGDAACDSFAYASFSSGGSPGTHEIEIVTDREVYATHTFDDEVYGASAVDVETSFGSLSTYLVLSGRFSAVDGVGGYGGSCFFNVATKSVALPPSYTLPDGEYVAAVLAPNGLSPASPVYVLTAASPAARKVYGQTAYDDLLLEDDEAASSLGLRNCYGDLFTGSPESVQRFRTVEGAAFVLVEGTRDIRITEDGGITSDTVQFPVWRILTSAFAVPTSVPSGRAVSRARIGFGDVPAGLPSGARVNVWVAAGERIEDPGDEAGDHRLYDATEKTVGRWRLAASVFPEEWTSVDIDIPPSGVSSVATFLFTAWIPQDAFNPASGASVPVGIGTLEADGYGIISGLGGGLKPTVELLP